KTRTEGGASRRWTVPSSATEKDRLPPARFSPSTCSGSASGGRMGSISTHPLGTSAVRPSSVRISSKAAAADQACGVQVGGYGTGKADLVPGEATEQLREPAGEALRRLDQSADQREGLCGE